jgi:hypothetical protein
MGRSSIAHLLKGSSTLTKWSVLLTYLDMKLAALSTTYTTKRLIRICRALLHPLRERSSEKSKIREVLFLHLVLHWCLLRMDALCA